MKSKAINLYPLVTIITVVYNGAKYLQEAIDSVRAQSYPNIEYLIIDGASTDGTVDLVRANGDFINGWISEPDEGIYDAMNKGIARAKGTYIGLLNADDVLLPDGVSDAVQALEALGEPGYTCGSVELIDEFGKRFGTSTPFGEKLRISRRFLEMPCPHLGVFVHRKIYKRYGVFDTGFRLRADYDLILRFIENDVPSVAIRSPLGKYRIGGASGGMAAYVETYWVHRKQGVSPLLSSYYFLRSVGKTFTAAFIPKKIKRKLNRLTISKNRYE